MATKYLLSIDGGGIRGLIPALALQRLEQVTGKPAREAFDFVAGTSTGALLAAAIAHGIPASKIVEIYQTRTKEIFKPQGALASIREGVLGHKYNISNLFNVLDDEFGKTPGLALNDLPIDILLTAKEVSTGKQWYFTRDDKRNRGTTGHLGLTACATASAAAPTYFDPFDMPSIGKLVDGGIGVAGNPVYEAVTEALYYSTGYTEEDLVIVSFGTGRFIEKQDPHSLLDWGSWVIDVLLNSPEEQQTELVARHYSKASFYRIDVDLPRNIKMDDLAELPTLTTIGMLLGSRLDWQSILNRIPNEYSIVGT